MESGRALWELIVVALVSGGFVALFTTLLRIRHEREELVRERMIAAADEVATGLIQATEHLQAAGYGADRSRWPDLDSWAAYVSEADRRRAEVLNRMGRVELFFGQDVVADAGYGSIAAIQEALWVLEQASYPISKKDSATIQRHITIASERMAIFTREARREITASPWRRWPGRGAVRSTYTRGGH